MVSSQKGFVAHFGHPMVQNVKSLTSSLKTESNAAAAVQVFKAIGASTLVSLAPKAHCDRLWHIVAGAHTHFRCSIQMLTLIVLQGIVGHMPQLWPRATIIVPMIVVR